MSKHLGGIIGCKYKTSSSHLNIPYINVTVDFDSPNKPNSEPAEHHAPKDSVLCRGRLSKTTMEAGEPLQKRRFILRGRDSPLDHFKSFHFLQQRVVVVVVFSH